MPKQAHAESSQIPLFEDLPRPLRFQEILASQPMLTECEPVQLSFSFLFPVNFSDMITGGGKVIGTIDRAGWNRAQLLKRAAFYTSSQSVKEVLDFCAYQAPEDTRPEVIEYLAERIIAAHEGLKKVRRPARPVKMQNNTELNSWPGIKTNPGAKTLIPTK